MPVISLEVEVISPEMCLDIVNTPEILVMSHPQSIIVRTLLCNLQPTPHISTQQQEGQWINSLNNEIQLKNNLFLIKVDVSA